MTAADSLDYEVADGIAEVAFDRPEKMNAYDESTLVALNEAVQDAVERDDVYALVLTGRGRAFCAGKDLDVEDETESKLTEAERLGKVASVMRTFYKGRLPTIAAVNGPAIGGGMELALACDFRVMAADAFLRDGHMAVGLTPATAGGWILPKLIGEARAKEYLLLGEDVDAETAADLGIAVAVTPTEETLSKAHEIAERLRDRPQLAVEHSKALIDGSGSFEAHQHAVLDARWECLRDSESQEAAAAHREGRTPEFGREYADD